MTWSDGMSDDDAVHRLQSIILLACEGNKDLANGREYRAIRSQLLRRPDLRGTGAVPVGHLVNRSNTRVRDGRASIDRSIRGAAWIVFCAMRDSICTKVVD